MKIVSLLLEILEEEKNTKIKVKNMEFDDCLNNSGTPPINNNQDLENFDDLGYYEGEEYEDTMGQIDEENDTKMASEDLTYLNDVSTKFELTVNFFLFYVNFFFRRCSMNFSKNCFNLKTVF